MLLDYTEVEIGITGDTMNYFLKTYATMPFPARRGAFKLTGSRNRFRNDRIDGGDYENTAMVVMALRWRWRTGAVWVRRRDGCAVAGGAVWHGDGVALATVYDDTFITTTTTYPDAVRTRYYNGYDLFATADFDDGALTITLQFSADGENWVDGYYVSEGYVLPLSYSGTLTNASGVTNTTTSTFTTSISGASASYESTAVPYRIVLTSDGGDYLRNVPTVGWYMRPKIEASGAVTDGVELLIQAVLRNN